MDIRNVLNGYFEKTKVPAELDPHNVSSFVVPKLTEKKEAATAEPLVGETDGSVSSYRPISVAQPQQSRQDESVNSARESAATCESGNVMGASSFIKIVRYHKLTGKEFLSILGNSKISNSAYQEIENNPGLTVKRLIELLEESPLTSADYEKLIIAVQRMSELKSEAKAKIKSEPSRVEWGGESASKTVESAKASGTVMVGAVNKGANKTSEGEPVVPAQKKGISPKVDPRIVSDRNNDDDDYDDYDDDRDEDYGEKNTENKKSKKLFLFGRHKTSDEEDEEDEDEDDEDDYSDDYDDNDGGYSGGGVKDGDGIENGYRTAGRIPRTIIDFGNEDDEEDDADEDEEDYDGYGRKRTGSNKGKIAAAAVGAAVLAGISFGLRYYLTGSLLPSGNSYIEEKIMSEAEIFDILSELPAPAPAFVRNDEYSAGGVREESVLKDTFCKNKRLMYIDGGKLYIYEQIGGQTAQLAVKDYADKTLLGIIEAGDKLAVISTGVSEPYSYSYSLPSESGADTVVTGTVERKETFVELLDAYAPENGSNSDVLRLSGSLAAAYLQDGRIIAVTYEGMADNAAKEDFATFMPYMSYSGDRRLCAADKVFIPSEASNGGFVSIFSIAPDGGFDIASAAGGSAQLISKNGSELFIGQGKTLIRYDIGEGVSEKGSCDLSGKISDFSGISVSGGEIRVTVLEDSAAALTVLDSELALLGEIKNIGVGEKALCTCFNGKETYVVTENGTCYGIDGDNSVMTQSTVKITNEKIYRYSDEIGIKITAADNGSVRTGLIVSTIRLDGSLSTLYNLEISSKTVAVNALDEYLSSPAEENIYCIGGTSENGTAVIPVVYFDGVSEVELFVICTVSNDGILSVNGSIIEYDRQSDRIFAEADGDIVIAVTKGKIITAKAQDGAVQGYFFTNGNK